MPQTYSRSNQRILKQAFEWFVELQSENYDSDSHRRFQTWLKLSEDHQLAYSEAERFWSDLDNLKVANLPTLDAARRAGPRKRVSPQAVVSVLLLATALGGWWQDFSAESLSYSTGLGERRNIELADGSHIELNTSTRLSVRLSWLRRRVELEEGEALFTVAHQALRPFSVTSGNLNITDIGTVFNVLRNAKGTTVSVLEGEVELRTERNWSGTPLKAGLSRRYDQYGHWQKIEAADADHAAAWTNGQLLFDHTPLADVAAELERYHDVHFVFADPSLASQTLSGSFDANDLTPFLKAAQAILPLKVQRQNRAIILSAKK